MSQAAPYQLTLAKVLSCKAETDKFLRDKLLYLSQISSDKSIMSLMEIPDQHLVDFSINLQNKRWGAVKSITGELHLHVNGLKEMFLDWCSNQIPSEKHKHEIDSIKFLQHINGIESIPDKTQAAIEAQIFRIECFLRPKANLFRHFHVDPYSFTQTNWETNVELNNYLLRIPALKIQLSLYLNLKPIKCFGKLVRIRN